jgi:hypothetical protein
MGFIRGLTIRGCTIRFYVAGNVNTVNPDEVTHETAVSLTQDFIHQKISYMGTILERLPYVHLRLLEAVPILIWAGGGSGGWYEPGSIGETRWINPRPARARGVDGNQVAGLPHSNGIISITERSLRNERTDCGFTLTHEIGHCVDFHLGLTSRPVNPAYRRGNRAYQGQKYIRNGVPQGYLEYEFRAETYSRLLMSPNRMCRLNDADPRCENHSIRGCSERLQRDLFNTPAFQAIRGEVIRYLPLAIEAIMRKNPPEIRSTGIRGPVGRCQDSGSPASLERLRPHAQGRIPGPLGLA